MSRFWPPGNKRRNEQRRAALRNVASIFYRFLITFCPRWKIRSTFRRTSIPDLKYSHFKGAQSRHFELF